MVLGCLGMLSFFWSVLVLCFGLMFYLVLCFLGMFGRMMSNIVLICFDF